MARAKKSRGPARRPGAAVESTIPTTYSPPIAPADFVATEAELASQFSAQFATLSGLWTKMLALHATLLERRAESDDASDLRLALDLLGAKAFTDARAAQVLLERGYGMGSLGPLRAAQESTELMQYFVLHPEEVEPWKADDKKFLRLDWVRDELPAVARESHGFMNWGMHPNWGLIPEFLRKQIGPLDTHYELVAGPVRNAELTEALSISSVLNALLAVGVLFENPPMPMSDIWVGEYRAVTSRLSEFIESSGLKSKENLRLRKWLADEFARDDGLNN